VTFDSLEYRKTLANFASSVCIVSTIIEDIKYGITISSFSSLSLSPPLILFCIGKDSKKYQYFVQTKMIAISILNANQKDISNNFSRNNHKYFDKIDFTIGSFSKCPIIKDALSFLECIIEKQYEGGDHTIFIAKVINHGRLNNLSPLIYFRSNYFDINQNVED
jgi:flavin reductase (DIM6/NTAB) family NADH-FMN oxidoreductase RutF